MYFIAENIYLKKVLEQLKKASVGRLRGVSTYFLVESMQERALISQNCISQLYLPSFTFFNEWWGVALQYHLLD